MRFTAVVLAALALAAPILAEEPAAAAAAAPAPAATAAPLSNKAEQFLSFEAKKATLLDGVVTFEGLSDKIVTTVGEAELAPAFAPGRIGPDAAADAVVTGKTPEGKDVLTVIHFSEPAYADGKLTSKARPVLKTDKPTLEGGEVEAALKNDKFVAMSPELKTATLTDVKVVVDSRAAPGSKPEGNQDVPAVAAADAPAQPAPAQPATAAAGRRLLYGGNVVAGAIVGSAVCGGSVVCAAVGADMAYHNQWHHHHHHHCCW